MHSPPRLSGPAGSAASPALGGAMQDDQVIDRASAVAGGGHPGEIRSSAAVGVAPRVRIAASAAAGA